MKTSTRQISYFDGTIDKWVVLHKGEVIATYENICLAKINHPDLVIISESAE